MKTARRLISVLALAFSGAAFSAGIALLDAPNIVEGGISVRPNLLFVLDNSGSMDWDYLPDWVVDDDWCKDSSGKVDGQGGIDCCRKQDGTAMNSSNVCLPSGTGLSDYRGMPPFHSADFNNIYYNPATTYAVPKNYDGSDKTSYSGASSVPWDGYNIQHTGSLSFSGFPDVEWCTDATYATCLRNDNYVLPGTVGGVTYNTMHTVTVATGTSNFATGSVTAPTTASRVKGPYYYVVIPGEYCTTKKLNDCATQTGPTTARPFPAKLRWCNNTALNSVDDAATAGTIEGCQGLKTSTYRYPLYPTIALTAAATAASPVSYVKITAVTQNSSFTINQITANGTSTLLASPISCTSASATCNTSSGTSSTRINNVRNAIATAVTQNGFSAGTFTTPGNGVVRITAPTGTTFNGKTLRMTANGNTNVYSVGSGNLQFELGNDYDGTLSTNDYDNGVFDSAGVVGGPAVYAPGSWQRIDIASGATFGNIVVSGTTVLDRSTRTDCAAAPSCTYDEELKNFANWFAWYRSRMQMMKSSVSLAFQTIDDKVRVGYFTINSPDMVSTANGINIKNFDSTHKNNWFTNIFKANPGSSTPLREALSKAGRLYAGQISVITDAKDPVQYSCQKNYTILSTDGYWNGNNGTTLSGATMADADGDGQSNTLADVASYYFNTDLRNTDCLNEAATNLDGVNYNDLCTNNVPTNQDAPNSFQHMITSTIGLGIDGVMKYRKSYVQTPSAEDLPDDYYSVLSATPANPSTGVCPWQTSGPCKWPVPGSDKQENIDDMWHAAVNGGGEYYSARSPSELRDGLETLLARINASTGGAAAATTSNPNVTTGDNFVFSSSFRTIDWYGELTRGEIDLTTGAILPGSNWSLMDKMDTAGMRSNIYTWSDAAGNKRKDFNYASLNSANEAVCNPPVNEKGCFNAPLISAWQQWITLDASQKTLASKEKLVNFLRGDISNEGTLYRDRAHTLGDIVSAEAVYNGRYVYSYTDPAYPGQGTPRSNPTVYVASNDGMLHAVNSETGEPRWSYIPSMALPKLYLLADKAYSLNHRFFVDGTPVVGDVQSSGAWKTILVGGLAGGGPGYYAIDITTQTDPTILWEMRKRPAAECATDPGPSLVSGVLWDCDLGHSFGNPQIAKVSGNWVVMVTSGYNNHTDGGDGKGYLYVLDAMTGSPLKKIATTAGDTVTPSGLGKISAWAEDENYTVKYVYGGDYLGNLWRFDAVNGSATLLKAFGATQPITAKPALDYVWGGGIDKRVIYVPTGSLVAGGDLSTTDQQSFYALWDAALDGKSASTMVAKSISGGSGQNKTATTCDSVFDDHVNLGWKINFSADKERGTTDPAVAFGTLVFSTSAPSSTSVCNPSGFESWVYNLDRKCGGVVNDGDSSTDVAVHYDGSATRPTVIVLPDNQVKSITRVSDGQSVDNKVGTVRIDDTGTSPRRVSWRELFD